MFNSEFSIRNGKIFLFYRIATKYQLGLEQENKQLLSESRALEQEVNSDDRKERALIRQCFDQLGSANKKIDLLDSESKVRENANSVLGNA